MPTDDYIIALLERIAYQTAHSSLELEDYLNQHFKELKNASRKPSTSQIHGHVCTCRSPAREVPKPKGLKGVFPRFARELTDPKDPQAA